MLAVQRAKADAFVSLAAPARRADDVLHDQLATQLPVGLLAQADSIMASLVKGDTVTNVFQMFASLFRPSVQPYLISWFRYSGSTEIAKLKIPVLIVQGSHDVQVLPSEADLLVKAQPKSRVAAIDGMNHVLKLTPAAKADQLRFYSDSLPPLAPGLVSALMQFLRGLDAAR